MLYIDLLRWDDLEKEVFTDDIRVDYTSLFGGEVVDVKSKDQIEAWKGLFKSVEKSQHISTYAFTPTVSLIVAHRDTVHSSLTSPNLVPYHLPRKCRSMPITLLRSFRKMASRNLYRMG